MEWKWDQYHEDAFDKIKKVCAPLLSFPITTSIQCDSSQHGLGAVLLQDNIPIDYTNKTLKTHESRLTQIEKIYLLAFVFTMEKCNDYTLGVFPFYNIRNAIGLQEDTLCSTRFVERNAYKKNNLHRGV